MSEVKHDPVGQKFFIPLENGEALLAYTQVNEILDVHHVILPEDRLGQGIEEKLATACLDFARKNGLRIIPNCAYMKDFIENHRDFDDLVEREL